MVFIDDSFGIKAWKWDNNSQLWVNISGTLPTSSSYYYEVDVCDMNNDGYADIIASGGGLLTVRDGSTGHGTVVKGGLYQCMVKIGRQQTIRKLILIK